MQVCISKGGWTEARIRIQFWPCSNNNNNSNNSNNNNYNNYNKLYHAILLKHQYIKRCSWCFTQSLLKKQSILKTDIHDIAIVYGVELTFLGTFEKKRVFRYFERQSQTQQFGCLGEYYTTAICTWTCFAGSVTPDPRCCRFWARATCVRVRRRSQSTSR